MLNIFVRSIIIYFFLLVAMRLMGKRQLGELQPFEFAITLVASELACIPMSDPTIPIIYGIIPVFTLFIVHCDRLSQRYGHRLLRELPERDH